MTDCLLDTSAVILVEKGKIAESILVDYGTCAISPATISELWHGVFASTRPEKAALRQDFVKNFIRRCMIIPFDEEIAISHARLAVELLRRGQMIGANDLIIAATSITHNMPLLTANIREFQQVPGLEVVGLD